MENVFWLQEIGLGFRKVIYFPRNSYSASHEFFGFLNRNSQYTNIRNQRQILYKPVICEIFLAVLKIDPRRMLKSFKFSFLPESSVRH